MNQSEPVFRVRVFIKKNWPTLLFLAFLVFTVYMNALFNDFVSDDRGVVQNASNASFAFTHQPLTAIRPLINSILYAIGGTSSALFRLPNILFHVGVVWLLFIIGSRLYSRFVGFVAAVLVAVHPIFVESITWISGGVYVQYGFFFLLSFLFYIQKKRQLFIFAIISFIATVFSSEKAVVLSLIFFVYELSFGSLKKNWKRLTPFLP